MSTFNETDASLKRVLVEGRLIEAMFDIIRLAARSPYDYKAGLADIEAIRAAANSQTAKRAMFAFHGRDRESDEADALEGLLDEWKEASRLVGPGRRVVPFPLGGGVGRIGGDTVKKVLRKAELPPPLNYPKSYEKQDDMIAGALYVAKYNLESTYQAIVALFVAASYVGQTMPKTIEAEVNKLRDALWGRARDFSREEMMFTLLLQDTTETTVVRKNLLKDTLGEGMSVMHYLVPFGELGSYPIDEEQRFRGQLKKVQRTKDYE